MIVMRTVPWHDITDVWLQIEPYVSQAVEHSYGTLTADAVLDAIENREMQAMVAVDEDNRIVGTLVTEVHRARSGMNYIHVVCLAGERFQEWKAQANDLLKGWAHTLDAPLIMATARRGWARRVELGWQEQAVTFVLDLAQ
jgi:hypothetical protein